MKGKEYGGVCPQESAEDFLPAYVEGLRIRLDSLQLKYSQIDLALFATQHRHPHHSHHKPQSQAQESRHQRHRMRFNALQNRLPNNNV